MEWIYRVKEKDGMNLWSKGEGRNEFMELRRRMEWIIYGVKEKEGMNLWIKGEGCNKSME